MNFNLGPLNIRSYADKDGFSNFQIGVITDGNGGDAARETAVRVGFKSEHLTQWVGEPNKADVFEDPDTGTLHFGRFCKTPTGVFYIPAKSVYTKALYQRAVKDGLQQAEQATNPEAAPTEAAAATKPQPKARKPRATKAAAAKPAATKAAEAKTEPATTA